MFTRQDDTMYLIHTIAVETQSHASSTPALGSASDVIRARRQEIIQQRCFGRNGRKARASEKLLPRLPIVRAYKLMGVHELVETGWASRGGGQCCLGRLNWGDPFLTAHRESGLPPL
ncbi:hypothetical protein J3F84DRAFT_264842 [Trichoderma pleuroticola]